MSLGCDFTIALPVPLIPLSPLPFRPQLLPTAGHLPRYSDISYTVGSVA
jgi:hypothetical protein